MKDDQIQLIEQQHGISLPSRYVHFLRTFPRIIKEMGYDDEKWNEHIAEGEFLDQAMPLLRLNQDFRGWACYDENGALVDTSSFWAIGNDLGGNFYLLRLADDDPQVYFYDHEEGMISVKCDDLEKFPYFLLELWRECEDP